MEKELYNRVKTLSNKKYKHKQELTWDEERELEALSLMYEMYIRRNLDKQNNNS